MKDSIRKIKRMELVCLHGQTGIFIRENLLTMFEKDKER